VTVAEQYGRVVEAAIESCTGAAALADVLATQAGWVVSLAHPGYVCRMKQNPDKTDFSDARMLADLIRVGYLPRVWLAPQEVRELRWVVRHRQQLVNERRNTKLRITALLREHRVGPGPGRRWTIAWLRWLTTLDAVGPHARWILDRHQGNLSRLGQEIAEVERRLDQSTANDPMVLKLRTLSGIGLVTACTLRAEIGRFDRFRSGRQVARFCGLTPRNASSGQRQADAGLIRASNRQLRATLVEAAQRLMRYDARWRSLAARMKGAGKPHNVVVAAVGNRWIRWLFHEMRTVPTAA
jgi:transposase